MKSKRFCNYLAAIKLCAFEGPVILAPLNIMVCTFEGLVMLVPSKASYVAGITFQLFKSNFVPAIKFAVEGPVILLLLNFAP